MALPKNAPPLNTPGGFPSPREILVATIDTYATRFMLTLAASLLLVTIAFNLPLDTVLNPIGWQSIHSLDQPTLEVVDLNMRENNPGTAGALITTFEINLEEVEDDDGEDPLTNEDIDDTEALPSPKAPPPIEKLKVRQAILDFADQQPDIEGGLGAYYINIEYPKEAINAGIEGRLILSFVVEPNGEPSHIEVERSLHALCDSSAVAALRKTRFIPGRQNGQPVRVRMKLPVRFTILSNAPPDSTSTQSLSSNRDSL